MSVHEPNVPNYFVYNSLSDATAANSRIIIHYLSCTVGHKSHDPYFHVFLIDAGVMTVLSVLDRPQD